MVGYDIIVENTLNNYLKLIKQFQNFQTKLALSIKINNYY